MVIIKDGDLYEAFGKINARYYVYIYIYIANKQF